MLNRDMRVGHKSIFSMCKKLCSLFDQVFTFYPWPRPLSRFTNFLPYFWNLLNNVFNLKEYQRFLKYVEYEEWGIFNKGISF